MASLSDIIGAVEEALPPRLQEEWDNTGWQVLPVAADTPCSGVLTCVDITPAVLDEAHARGCNLVIAHHPLLFRPVRSLRLGAGRVDDCVIRACAAGIALYASHTAADSARGGINTRLADALGLTDRVLLHPCAADITAGMGVAGTLPRPLTAMELVEAVKKAVDTPAVRVSRPLPGGTISRVGLCGGAGFDFLQQARACGATAYITSDIRYHEFVDHGSADMFLVDISHHDAEKCAKDIFNSVIRKKFANFAVYNSSSEENPVIFL